ncbi:hypothetical protein CHCC20348_3560 [Bacillus paralicheniformis]|nr:hypothetical protein CHCC20348_3560 [Bacillus paralicheniformis]
MVDFPDPFIPTKPIVSPSYTSKETFRTAKKPLSLAGKNNPLILSDCF